MKYYLQLGVILMIFCVIATGILAYVNSVTEPKIEALKAEESIKSREELIPDCDFEEVVLRDGFSYFIATDKETNELKGYTFTAQKKGYGSVIKTMAGLDPEFRVIGIKIVDQSETPAWAQTVPIRALPRSLPAKRRSNWQWIKTVGRSKASPAQPSPPEL